MKIPEKGMIAAVSTPMNADGSLKLDQVGAVVDHLIRDNISGIYICGSTGEGPLLAVEERLAVADAFVKAAQGKLLSIVQVGHTSLTEARTMAVHAQRIGADAISAIPPTYFPPTSLDVLLDCLADIVSAALDIPFYYYHIPPLTSVKFNMVEFLQQADERLPSLAGIKFSSKDVDELQACLNFQDGRFTILYGVDEMLLSGVWVGVAGAVGSTFNFAAPLYQRIIAAVERGNVEEACEYQARSVAMVRILHRYRGNPAYKAMMKLIGVADLGPVRLPLKSLTKQEMESLKQELMELGFFDWIR